MSGGSFNYLCYVYDLPDLVNKRDELESMRVALSALGYAEEEARETQELLDLIAQLESAAKTSIERLSPVWKAVEWWRSSDYSEEQVREAVRKLRKDQV